MRKTSFINNSKCLEWGLNMQQGALFDLLNQLHAWAEPISIDGEVYYWASRQMICNQIPLAYNKVDTVYRALKTLSKKGLINYKKHGEKDCISLTAKGKEWNSEINPILGNESEQTRIEIRDNSEVNPTYKNININNIKKINKKDFDPVTVKPKNVNLEVWKNWIDYRNSSGKKLQPQSWTKQAQMLEGQNNPEEVINQSIMNGWQGLFPAQKKAKAITNISASNTPSTQDETSWIDDIEGEFF